MSFFRTYVQSSNINKFTRSTVAAGKKEAKKLE
jgi:hypothetical protein